MKSIIFIEDLCCLYKSRQGSSGEEVKLYYFLPIEELQML